MSEADGVLSEAEGIRDLTRDRTAVVLVTASWCGPCLPAPTVLRELDRRWDGAVHAVLIEDPSDDVLDQLAVDVLPVWLQLTASERGTGIDGVHGDREPAAAADIVTERTGAFPLAQDLTGTGRKGSAVRLAGEWAIAVRHDGALPKHEVDTRFGPSAGPSR